MANRTVIVDNNTWNNSHIATVGRAMASPEAKAWRIYRWAGGGRAGGRAARGVARPGLLPLRACLLACVSTGTGRRPEIPPLLLPSPPPPGAPRSLDVKYVFVVFGGLIGYSSDDINKFLWMVGSGWGGVGWGRGRARLFTSPPILHSHAPLAFRHTVTSEDRGHS
jgi:hypothetical protein